MAGGKCKASKVMKALSVGSRINKFNSQNPFAKSNFDSFENHETDLALLCLTMACRDLEPKRLIGLSSVMTIELFSKILSTYATMMTV
jgi:hypothetical protein